MRWTRRLAELLWPNARKAREAMETARAGEQHVDDLVRDLNRLHQANHFSQALARTLSQGR